jgi:hypothetical protein
VWGRTRRGLRQKKYLPQSPFRLRGKFCYITTFGIAFYQSNLSTLTEVGGGEEGGYETVLTAKNLALFILFFALVISKIAGVSNEMATAWLNIA